MTPVKGDESMIEFQNGGSGPGVRMPVPAPVPIELSKILRRLG